MLNGTSHHPKGRKRWSHPALFIPIPTKAKLSSRNEQKMHRAMARASPKNQIQQPKNSRQLIWAIRQLQTNHTKPDPRQCAAQDQHRQGPSQQIENHRSVSQWHLTRPNRLVVAALKALSEEEGHTGCVSSMKT